MNKSRPIILLVEDNDDDVFLMQRALKKSGIEHTLHLASDGQMALDYLSGEGPHADRELHPLPDYVFLDLKLPYRDGFEVLEWIRHQDFLNRSLAVFILTSSPEERDKKHAEELGARHYLVKPPTPDMLRAVCEGHLGSA